MALLDTDEFLFSPSGYSLVQVLEKYNAYGGVALAWLRFGTSNHLVPPPLLTTEAYTRRMKDPSNNWKNIVQPARVGGVADVHEILFHSGYYAVDERHQQVSRHTNRNVDRSYSVFRLHHYFTRSCLDWWLRVYDRGAVSGAVKKYKFSDLKYYNRANELVDKTALRLAAQLRDQLNWNGTAWQQQYFPANKVPDEVLEWGTTLNNDAS